MHIRTLDDLRHRLYGWSEDVDRKRLFAPDTKLALSEAIERIQDFLETEVVEIGSDPDE